MLIRLVRDDLLVKPFAVVPVSDVVEKGNRRFWRNGAVIDVCLRDAQLLVGNGDAEPASEETENAIPNWRHNREQVLLSREMIARFIEPDDRERYRRGEIVGYDESGEPIPGPNFKPEDTDEDDE